MREPVKAKTLRCAIYTRKSSEEGLEQDFNSLEAQREACEAYIKSQAHEGWTLVPDHFDDGGYSGGNTDRPGLARLMGMVRASEVDIIVIYKIDRLTRSLTDFARLAEDFDKHGVSFVSITQQFNTTTSMGRLMLNVLLSFAQFEREVTGERIRDKFAASKRRGMWMGGPVPLGYDIKDRGLVINEKEAKVVRKIFDLYLELENVRLVSEELQRLDLKTKRALTRTGRETGGLSFTRGHLYRLLANPIYVGDVSHKGERHKGLHDAIVDVATWDSVHAILDENMQGERRGRKNTKEPSLLAGLIVDEFGNKLTATHAVKDGKRYRYYSSRALSARGSHNQPVSSYRIAASDIEPVVIREIVLFLGDPHGLTDALEINASEPHVIGQVITAAKALGLELSAALPSRQREMLAEMIERVEFGEGAIKLKLLRDYLGERLLGESGNTAGDPIVIQTAANVTRSGGDSRLIVEEQGGGRARTARDDSLVRAIACGRAWFEEMASGRATSFGEIAARAGVTDRYVSRIVDLAFLAPCVVEAILSGDARPELTVKSLTVDGSVPVMWAAGSGR